MMLRFIYCYLCTASDDFRSKPVACISSYMESEIENIETIPWNPSIFELEIRQRLAITSNISWNTEADFEELRPVFQSLRQSYDSRPLKYYTGSATRLVGR